MMWSSLVDSINADSRWTRAIAIAAVSVLVTAVASVGELEYRGSLGSPEVQDVDSSSTGGSATTDGGSGPSRGSSGGTVDPTDQPSATSGDTDGGATDGGTADGGDDGTTGPSEPQTTGTETGSTAGSGTTGPTTPPTGTATVPNFGLRTQGVTDEHVKFGISYNEASCGDAGVLEAMLGAAATGDIDRAIDAFTRHINDNGGVNGREWQVYVGDDGGGGCPEKALAAARYLVDDEQVFAVFPGLHDVADYVQSRSVPTYVGRDDPASLQRYGPNGIGLIQEIEGNLEAWTAFGDYYLDSRNHKPCIVRPESGVSGDWDLYSQIFHRYLDRHGIVMVDELVYQDDVSTAQQQSSTGAARLKAKGCDQVYFMAPNPIAPIFFTQAASQQQWYPTWTFTSYMVLSDTDLGGSLQDQQQWDNAVGLSSRIPPGEHPREGNCRTIYERYYGNDGQSESAAVQLVCAAFLPAAEMMLRGEQLTGELTANSMLVGAHSMGDYYYDAHVPLSWRFPGADGPFTTKALRHYTVVDWDSDRRTYDFPEYPLYWEVMGPGKSNGIDLRSAFQ
ncbi:MAG TPA: ABC transporter substrate-binding protein [Nitriliruptorales bacterium]